MEKIKLEICTGTACYLLGSAELLEILENLSSSLSERVEIRGVPCQGFCRTGGTRPPYISINGEIKGEMNPEKLLSFLQETRTGGNEC